MSSAARPVLPLVVDLDGTLLKTDLLVESFLHLLAKKPSSALRALLTLKGGKAAFKARLADEAILEMHLMPVNPALAQIIAERRAQGGEVVLASASDERYVRALADHLGWFDRILGSAGGVNLSGRNKATKLVEIYGERGFDYAGNDAVDMHIWEQASTAYLAGGDAALARRLRRSHSDVKVLPHDGGGARAYLRAMRPHQWLKNILVFAPAVAGHTLIGNLPALLVAFMAFNMCASSVYITNDLLDLSSDRAHPRKSRRPFASGAASAKLGTALAVALLIGAFGLSLLLPIKFLLALGLYYLLTTSYSLYLKRKPIVDVITLACLYGMRVIAGGFASGTLLSPWLEALSIFLFLSLALVKRCAELVAHIQAGKGELTGRGYRLADLPALEAMAAAAGYNSALILALYLNSSPELQAYAHPHRLWLLCILLIAWLSRIVLLTRRGEMHDDPVVYSVKDRWSLVLGLCCAAVFASATI